MARYNIVRRPWRAPDCCQPNLRANGAALRFSSSAKLQRRRWLAADAGINRLGQRRNGRTRVGQRSPKMLYLPYAHTDFIFPIIGEELGLRFSLLVIFLFVVIIVCGILIALHSKDRFGLLLGCGVVSLLALQAA